MLSRFRYAPLSVLLFALPALAQQAPNQPAPPQAPPVTTTPTSPPVTLPVTPPTPPPPPPTAVVLSEPAAAAWLSEVRIPVTTVSETDLPKALDTAALAVVPLQEVRQPATVDALKSFVARGGRVLGTYWGPVGIKTPVAAGLSSLFSVNVTGWSGKGNTNILGVGAGKPLFNGTGRLRLGRGYAVVATTIIPPAPPAPKPAPAPTSKTPNGKTPATANPNTTATPPTPPTPPPPPPPPPPFTAGRWVRDDGRALRSTPDDAAVVETPNTIWVGEDLFAADNDSPEVRRWFANAAVTIAPNLRLAAKQALVTAAQANLDAARAAVAAAKGQGFDISATDADARLADAASALTAANAAMDFGSVLKNLDNASDAMTLAQAAATPSRPVEVRAAWIDETALTRSPADIHRLVTRLADAGFNVILPETVYRGRASYPSSIYPQDKRFSGFDPLRLLVDEAHRRGMEVHPWVWTLCAGADGEQGPILASHPEWAARDRAGRIQSDVNGLFWMSPAIPAVRTTIRNVIREIAAKYDVDGIQVDYLRYHSPYYDYSDDARAAYKAKSGVDPVTLSSISPGYVNWHLWRESLVDSLVKEIHDDLASVKPGLKLGAAVYQTPTDARRERLQDWGLWAANHWVDWVAPMTTTTDTVELSRWIADDQGATSGAAYLVPSIDGGALPDETALAAQIAVTRAAPTQGIAVSSASNLSDDALKALKLGVFRIPATTPWKNPLQAARGLASAAADRLKAIPVTDAAAADPIRTALADATAYAAKTDLSSLATQAPASVDAVAKSGPAADDARALVADARAVAAVATAPATGNIAPTAPPLVTITSPLPLPTARVPLTTGIVTVDGKLDEAAWNAATTLPLSNTSDGGRAPVPTTVKLMRDSTTLYIGVTCTEPKMDAIKAANTGKDGPVYQDDSVEIFLNPNGRGLPYYHFIVGAGGGTWDALSGDNRWNTRWTSAVSRDTTSWTAEIAIPFSAIDATASGAWRANVARNRTPDGPSYLVWSVPYGTYHTPDRFGTWEF